MNQSSFIRFTEIRKLAIPAIFSGISEPLISMIDVAFIGRVGVLELDAVVLGSSFFLLMVWTLAQTKTAISAIVSKNYGANTIREIQSLIPQSILLNFGLGVVIFFGTWLFATHIFQLYSAQGDLLTYAVDYYKIRSMGYPFTLVAFGIFGIFRGLQNTTYPMIISLSGVVVNTVLDYLFIFGWKGIINPMGLSYGLRRCCLCFTSSSNVDFYLGFGFLA